MMITTQQNKKRHVVVIKHKNCFNKLAIFKKDSSILLKQSTAHNTLKFKIGMISNYIKTLQLPLLAGYLYMYGKLKLLFKMLLKV